MATKILNAFQSVAPDQTVAMAAQIHDERLNKKQQEINQDFENELNSLQLNTDELDAIVNEVDMTGKYIEFTVSGNTVRAYRKSAFDVAKTGYNLICFCKVDGTKYFIRYTGTWSDSSSTIDTGTNVYDSTDTSAVATVTGGTEGFVVEGQYVEIYDENEQFSGIYTFVGYVPNDYTEGAYALFQKGENGVRIGLELDGTSHKPTTDSDVKKLSSNTGTPPQSWSVEEGFDYALSVEITAVHGF